MKLSKRHYKMIARIIHTELLGNDSPECRQAVANIAHALADIFTVEDAEFVSRTWLTACGVTR